MKRTNTFAWLGLAALALLLASCSNLSDTVSEKAQSTEAGTLTISLAPQGRYIKAGEYSLSSVAEWTMFLYAYNESNKEYSSSYSYYLSWDSTTASSSTASIASLSYNQDTNTLTASKIATGTYKITITGSYETDSDITYNITGTKEGITISNKDGADNSATILVGLMKSEPGKGGLFLTLESADASNFFSMIKNATATLAPRQSPGTTYSKSDKSLSLSTDNGYVLSAANSTIKSGWYTLSFEYEGYRFSLSDTEIEIADGIATTGTIAVTVTQSKAYYATNDSNASGNGLSSVSRINLTKLLKAFGDTFPKEGEINIYVNGDPEINLYALSLAEEKMATETNNGKIVTIYNESSSIALAIYVNSETADDGTTYTAISDISAAITVTADEDADGNKYTTLDAGYITVESGTSYTVTLKDGAALSIASDVSDNLGGTLGICAIKEDEDRNITDNFDYYDENNISIIKAASSIKDNLVLYDKDENETSYTVTETPSSDGSTYTCTVSSNSSSYDGEIASYRELATAASNGGKYLIPQDITVTNVVRVVNELTLVAEEAVTITRGSESNAIFHVGYDGNEVQTGAVFTLGSTDKAANKTFDSIMQGLSESLMYAKGDTSKARKTSVTVADLPAYHDKEIKQIREDLNLTLPAQHSLRQRRAMLSLAYSLYQYLE